MRKLLAIAVLMIFGLVSIAQAQKTDPKKKDAPKKDGPSISFEKDTYDFGKIEEGTVPKYQFKFTNTGNQPLVITNVRPSCGCTSPSWSKEPVMPGKSGYIEAAYNSKGRPGAFTKSITVSSNIPDQTHVLFIKGEVIPAPAAQDPNTSPVRIQENNH